MTIKVAVIGCGYWGKNLVRNFSELGALYAVCDTNTEHAKALSEQYGVPALELDDVLSSDVEGIVIASPAVMHYDLAAQALKAGKHVFVEKPLALELEQAEELCALSVKHDRTLMVGHLLQYHPAFLELKDMVAKGKLGKLQYMYSNRLNLGKFRNEENILWSFAPHDISMILSLAHDLPKKVYASGQAYLNPNIYDVTTTHMEFDNGLRAHIFVSWLHPFKEQKLVVVGDKGMIVFNDGLDWGEKLQFYSHGIEWIDGVPQANKAEAENVFLETSEPLKLECRHFLESIEKKQAPVTDGIEGLNVLKVLKAAQISLTEQKHVNLDQKSQAFFSHSSAVIDPGCDIGAGTKIWHFSHILKNTTIGENCTIGQNVMAGPDVTIGDDCKIQNNVSLYKGVTLEDGVFCGPSCVFTNVHNPRATIERKDEFRETLVETGVTIGANATILCGHTLGRYALIGAGAVITKDVPAHAIMAGNPAKRIGWASHAGETLGDDLICPREKRKYKINSSGDLEEIEEGQNVKSA